VRPVALKLLPLIIIIAAIVPSTTQKPSTTMVVHPTELTKPDASDSAVSGMLGEPPVIRPKIVAKKKTPTMEERWLKKAYQALPASQRARQVRVGAAAPPKMVATPTPLLSGINYHLQKVAAQQATQHLYERRIFLAAWQSSPPPSLPAATCFSALLIAHQTGLQRMVRWVSSPGSIAMAPFSL
jgi:hypothetical protein